MKFTSEVREFYLIKDLNLDACVIKKGEKIDALKVTNEDYKVFHHTGWWQVDKSYFEGEINEAPRI